MTLLLRGMLFAVLFFPMVASAAQFVPPGQVSQPVPTPTRAPIGAPPTIVNCANRPIGPALNTIAPNLHIQFMGTCNEIVVIKRDQVTLEGIGGATIVGSIQVVGATQVHLRDFTIRDNAVTEGTIEALFGSSIILTDVTVENSLSRGVLVRDSVAQFFGDVTIRDSGTVGLLGRGARLTLEANMLITNSGQFDIILTAASTAFSPTGNTTLTASPGGMLVQNSSSFEGVFGSLTSTGHPLAGLIVATHGTFNYALALNLSNNGVAGLLIDEVSSVSPFDNITAQAQTIIMNNGVVGVAVQADSTLTLGGSTTITGNGVGVLVDNSKILGSADAEVTGNSDVDLLLQFGSSASFDGGNNFGTVACEDSVLTRGDVSCPPAP